jgi:Leucine-rich repeat (LRR) protein
MRNMPSMKRILIILQIAVVCVLLPTGCDDDHGTTVDAPKTVFYSFLDAMNHQENVEELRLSGIGDSLSPAIGLFPKLFFLGVYDSDIRYLPDEITNLRIMFLWLPNCKFQHIPPQICALHGLGYLIFDGNEIETIPNEFNDLKYISTLSLQNNKLESFPRELFVTDHCRLLQLDSNRLTTFDFSRADLPEINYLSLVGNPLPDSVKQRLKKEFGDKVKL